MANCFGMVIMGLLLLTMVITDEGCTYPETDIVFALDESGSISDYNFDLQLQFVKNLVSMFDIGPNDNQVGAVTFDHDYELRFDLDEHHNLPAVEAAIESIFRSGYGYTDIPKVIKYVRTVMFASNNGARNNVNKVAVILTDGYGGDIKAEAAAAKAAGIVIIAIGVGGANTASLKAMAYSENHYMYVSSFQGLNSELETLGLLACADVCPNGWTQVSGSCYLIVSCPLLNQDDALEACDAEGGDLLRIDSLTELNALRAEIQGDPMLCYPKYWTGGYEPNNDGNWYWRDFGGTDIPISSTELYWGINEPNELHNDREHCINLLNLHGRDYYYNDALCNRKMGYICKMHL